MTFGMNVSRFMNLSAIFSLDLESQYNQPLGLFIEEWMEINRSNNIMDTNILFIFFIFQYCSRIFPNILCLQQDPINGVRQTGLLVSAKEGSEHLSIQKHDCL